MFAGEFHAPRQVRLIDFPEPELSGDGMILFQPELACLCGSDLTYFEGDYPEFQPKVGQSLHEMIGRVVATTGDKFREGDRVLCVPSEHFGLLERFVASEKQAIAVDPRPPLEHALMAQPLGTVICALKKLPHLIDQTVVVIGQGPMGQLWNRALSNVGARDIIAIDLLGERLEVSPQMGATHTVNASNRDPVEAVRDFTDGRMADLVVEVVGHREQVLNTCIEMTRDHGKILFFGVPTETIDGIQWKKMFWKNISIVNSVGPSFETDFPLAMKWIAEERFNVAPLITHRFPIAQIQEAFDLFFEKRDGSIKVLVDM